MIPPARNRPFALAVGVAMLLGGLVIVAKSIATGRPVTSSRFLDVVFMAFFFLRGGMYLASARRRPPAA